MASAYKTFKNWNVLKYLLKDEFNIVKSRCLTTQVAAVQSNPIASSDLVNPIRQEDFFNLRNSFTIKQLFDARVHYGHTEGTLNPKMKPFIFGSRLGHLIFDLDCTADMLFAALNFTAHIAYRDGIILLVSQNTQSSFLIETMAKECKEFAHTRFWKQGTFTNSSMFYGAVTRLPDLIIMFNTLTTVLEEHPAMGEAAKMVIPVVGIVDTNCNPNLVTYPVPGNDDTLVAIELYCQLFKNAILTGKKRRLKMHGY